MNEKHFTQLESLINHYCREENYHDFQSGVHGQWLGDKARQYKLLLDADTGDTLSIQRVGTQRVFHNPAIS